MTSVSLVDAPFLRDRKLAQVFAALDGRGEELRVVGGAVRDALLGAAGLDVDLATTATPDETMRRAKLAGLRVVPTGFEHGTVTVIVEGRPFEVTTLREDIQTDGRHAKVRFGRDFAADALRRDFTINALSADQSGRVYDYTDGLGDIARRKVRFIGVARQRIREDYLRIIRFFRFQAAYGAGDIDREGLEAAIAERAGLENLSRERIGAEMLKMMRASRVAAVAQAMSDAGILGQLAGGVTFPARLGAFLRVEAARGLPPDAIARLGALCVLVQEDAERLGQTWRLSNVETARLMRGADAWSKWHGRAAPPGPGRLREMLFADGRRAALDACLLAWADACGVDEPVWNSAWRFLNDTPEPRLPFSGAELLARGVPSGRGMGEMLKRLQVLWIEAGFPSDPNVLAELLDAAREP